MGNWFLIPRPQDIHAHTYTHTQLKQELHASFRSTLSHNEKATAWHNLSLIKVDQGWYRFSLLLKETSMDWLSSNNLYHQANENHIAESQRETRRKSWVCGVDEMGEAICFHQNLGSFWNGVWVAGLNSGRAMSTICRSSINSRSPLWVLR